MTRPRGGSWGGAWCVTAATVPEAVDVTALRKREAMTQAAFAKCFGLTEGFVRDCEQGRKKPTRAALAYLRVIEAEPDAVNRALKSAGPTRKRRTAEP